MLDERRQCDALHNTNLSSAVPDKKNCCHQIRAATLSKKTFHTHLCDILNENEEKSIYTLQLIYMLTVRLQCSPLRIVVLVRAFTALSLMVSVLFSFRVPQSSLINELKRIAQHRCYSLHVTQDH